MSNKFQYSKLAELFLMFLLCLFCGCGQIQRETKEAVEPESEMRNPKENAQEEAEDFSANDTSAYLPDNEAIRESIYSYYGRKEDEEISGEELEAVKGKLSIYSPVIHSGEEFTLMREWYDWDNLDSYSKVSVVFSEDLTDWREEDLEALKILKCNVSVESSGETVPVRALSYLTGATNLGFSDDSDITDVSGTMPEGRSFPQQIKRVWLNHYREGKYTELLRLLQDSQVEKITVRPDPEEKAVQRFWLDDVAGIDSLEELILEDITIRVRETASLSGCPLKRIEGYVDAETDLGFVEVCAGLEAAECGVLTEMDLSPFLEKRDLSLYLYFCRQIAESEERGYEGESYVVCPAFYKAVSWPGEPGDERFPAIYQRGYDQGRIVECFTERFLSYHEEKISNMWSFDPWIRVTDGSKVYELKPGQEEGVDEEYAFGSFRTDRMSLVDINFDGVEDIVLDAGGFGNQMLNYEFGWIWNRSTGAYEYEPTYLQIGNPSVDQEHQIVRSFWRNSAGSHGWAIYRYTDGAFEIQSELTEDFLLPGEIPEELAVPEDAEVIRWQETVFENGEPAEVKNAYAVQTEEGQNVYPKVYESYYEPDSYWGSPDE